MIKLKCILQKVGLNYFIQMAKKDNNIDSKVAELLEKNNITQAPVDIEKIAKNEDLKVIKSSDFEPDLSGMIINKTVYLNKNMSENRNRFTLSHELGHYLLHNLDDHKYKPVRFRADGIPTEEQQREQEANRFAAELLMPRSFLEEKLKNKDYITEDDIEILAKEFKVSVLAMSYRLDNLGFSL